MKKKKLNLFLLIVFVFVFASCSDNDKIGEYTFNPKDVKLVSDKTYIEPFEELPVYLNNTDKELETFWNIGWDYSGGGLKMVFSSSDITKKKHFRKAFLFTASQPGKAIVYVTLYDKKEIAYVKSLEYGVTQPKGDFFVVNWNNFEERKVYSSAEHIEGIEGIQFWLLLATEFIDKQNKKNPYTHITHSFIMGNGKDADEWKKNENSRDRLVKSKIRDLTLKLYREFIIANYGESILKYECADGEISQTPLRSDYEKRFKYVLRADDYPVEIWETPYTNIALITDGKDDLPNKMNSYYIIAEPR